jgi:hypothetical protein
MLESGRLPFPGEADVTVAGEVRKTDPAGG